jgi:hypothetical protein
MIAPRTPIEAKTRFGTYQHDYITGLPEECDLDSVPDNWIEEDWLFSLVTSAAHGTPFVAEFHTADERDPIIEQSGLKREFDKLAQLWYADTAKLSIVHQMAMHPAYQAIIGMGRDALPFIFRELQQTRDHWLWALNAITRQDASKPNQTFDQAVDAWLDWGKNRGYL